MPAGEVDGFVRGEIVRLLGKSEGREGGVIVVVVGAEGEGVRGTVAPVGEVSGDVGGVGEGGDVGAGETLVEAEGDGALLGAGLAEDPFWREGRRVSGDGGRRLG